MYNFNQSRKKLRSQNQYLMELYETRIINLERNFLKQNGPRTWSTFEDTICPIEPIFTYNFPARHEKRIGKNLMAKFSPPTPSVPGY